MVLPHTLVALRNHLIAHFGMVLLDDPVDSDL